MDMTKRSWAGIAAITASALTSTGLYAAEGDWLVRVRALHMDPSNDNSITAVVPALGEVEGRGQASSRKSTSATSSRPTSPPN